LGHLLAGSRAGLVLGTVGEAVNIVRRYPYGKTCYSIR